MSSAYREAAKRATASELTLKLHLRTRLGAVVMFALPAFAGIALGFYFFGRDTPFAFGIAPVSLGVLMGLAFALPMRKPFELDMSVDGRDLVVDGGKRIPIARIANVVTTARGEIVVELRSLEEEEFGERVTLTPQSVHAEGVEETAKLRAFLDAHGWSGEAA